MPYYKAKRFSIPDFNFIDDFKIGLFLNQLPNQIEFGDPIKIKSGERESNLTIIKNLYGKSKSNLFSNHQEVNVILFPEFSLTIESSDYLLETIENDLSLKNKIYFYGVEQLTREQFFAILKDFNNSEDFVEEELGASIKYINTGVLIIKDNKGNIFKYLIPKMKKSNYEQSSQYQSNRLFLFTIGHFNILFTICSDLIISENSKEGIQDAIESLENELSGEYIILHLIFHIEQNSYPFTHYPKLLRDLRFKKYSNKIDTTDTIICAVNDAFNSYSNVSVMGRGRDPQKLKTRPAEECFYWNSFEKMPGEEHTLFNYIKWRLKGPGAISFILNTNNSDCRVTDPSHPIAEPAIFTISTTGDVKKSNIKPEHFVLEDFLNNNLLFIVKNFISREFLINFFTNSHEYKKIFNILFDKRPIEIIKKLFSLYDNEEILINCDCWDNKKEIFSFFLMWLKILHTKFQQSLNCESEIRLENKPIIIVDCNDSPDYIIKEENRDKIIELANNYDIIFFQRLRQVSWSGEPKIFNNLLNEIDITKDKKTDAAALEENTKINSAKSPYVINLFHITNELEKDPALDNITKLKEKLNDYFRFTENL